MTQDPSALDTATDDRLLNGRVRLRQPRGAYRVAVDPILLAAAVTARPGDRILDLGSGTGAAALCLRQRIGDCTIVGLERDPELLALARENAVLNGAAHQVDFVLGDAAAPPPQIVRHGFDHVMSNPPYLTARRADLRSPASVRRASANIETTADLPQWISAMIAAVKPKARITVIHRADRLDELLAELRRQAGEIVVFPLWPKAGRDAKRVLVTARSGVATPLRLAPGLVLHEPGGQFTPAAREILENGAALAL